VIPIGSSPHARGKVKNTALSSGAFRIIPACAGKSRFVALDVMDEQDHPRMRGEKVNSWFRILCIIGSSPHARGKDRGT